MAARYSIGKTSLSRHLANHASPALVAMSRERSAGDSAGQNGTLVEQLRLLIQRTQSILFAAEQGGNVSAALAAIREVRQSLELLGRASGELSERPSVVINLVATQEWLSIRTTLLQVLARHPAAQLEVADALAAAEAER